MLQEAHRKHLTEYSVCSNRLGARRGVHSSLKMAEGKRRFPGFGTSGYSLTYFTGFSIGIHYLGKFWKFLLPLFLPFFFLLPKMMQGLFPSFFTVFFILVKTPLLMWCLFNGWLFLMSVHCLLERSGFRKHPILTVFRDKFSKFTQLLEYGILKHQRRWSKDQILGHSSVFFTWNFTFLLCFMILFL